MSNKTVYVGMSGGVDSSLTAALLKKQGYQVVGVYMKNWTDNIAGYECPWKEDYRDAKRVAVELDIPFKVFDFQKEYRAKVVDYMLKAYQEGITPNPDIMCNQEIKFRLFLDTALEDGADMIATGHYARILDNTLLTAKDKLKDQTYFLYRMPKVALSKTIMPIGEFLKSEVRKMAKELNLYTADKKDSQGICFVGKVGIKDFLINELGPQPHGLILDEHNKEIGTHDGAIYYTIGQRHGLNIGGGLPYYVIKKDLTKNILYVTKNLDSSKLWANNLTVVNPNWLVDPSNLPTTSIKVRTRYRAPLESAKLTINSDQSISVKLTNQIKAMTSGQSAVFYHQDVCLGGGIIV